MKKNFKGLKVLLTGGDGFIGSHLVEGLVKLGAKIFSVVEPDSDLWRIDDFKNNITVLRSDICDVKLKAEIKKINPDKAFHLASFVDPARDLSLLEEMLRVNLGGTINFIAAFKGLDCEAIVNTGTCEEYGGNKAPFKEADLPHPVSPYSASKVAGTFYCQMLYGSFGVPVVTLRPFLTYGPRQSTDLFIPSLIKSALQGKDFEMTKGDQTREFNYVTDIVDAFIKAASTPKAIGKIINIGCGKDYKIKDVARKIVTMTGRRMRLKIGSLSYREGEVKRFYCDNNVAKNILGWSPKVGLDEGLRRTIEWYKKETSSN